MKVTFCGHGKEEYGEAVSKRLYEIIEELIKSGADEFLKNTLSLKEMSGL